MNRDDFCRVYWDYFLVLEKDMLNIERYVSFDLGDNAVYDSSNCSDFGNSLCFSNEFVKQYQTICSEVDVILKTICREIMCSSTASNMTHYTEIVLKHQNMWNGLPLQDVKIQKTGIILKPFSNWRCSPNYHAPDWFPIYNHVKHDRTNHSRDANLKNTLNALAGLYLLEVYFVKYIADRDNNILKHKNEWSYDSDIPDVPNDTSKLFEAIDFQTRYRVTGRDIYSIPNDLIDTLVNK